MSSLPRPLKWPPIFPLDKGLVAWYPFDDRSGAVLRDRSGKKNHGTISGATWVAGKRGSALSFDGVDEYVQVTHSLSLMPTYVSVSAWMKPVEILPNAKGIVRKGAGWGENGYALLYVNGDVRFGIADAGGEDWIAASSSLVDLDVFCHVVGVYDGTKIYVYVNGVLANSKTTVITIGSNTYDTHLGDISGYNWSFFHGVIDEVRIYNRALSAAEIKRLYESELMLVRH